MKILQRYQIHSIALGISILLTAKTYSQSFTFRTYGIEDGLSDRFIYTMNQDRHGYLWFGTGGGLCRFDGFEFRTDIIKDSIPASYVRHSYRDRNGNLWLGHDDGTISLYDGFRLHIIHTGKVPGSRINDIREDNQGKLVFATQSNGLVRIDPADRSNIRWLDVGELLVYSIEFTEDDQLMVATQDSLCIYSYPETAEVLSFLYKIDLLPHTKFQNILKTEGGVYYTGTSDNGIFRLKQGNETPGRLTAEDFGKTFGIGSANIQHMFMDADKNLWISTFRNGMIKIEYDTIRDQFHSSVHYSRDNGLGYNDITRVLQDLEGNIWVSTYGNGLAMLLNEAFIFYRFTDEQPGESITALYVCDGKYWLAGETGILRSDPQTGEVSAFYPVSGGLPHGAVSSIYCDPYGTVWIGTRNDGLYRLDKATGQYKQVIRSSNSLENTINYVTGTGSEIWLATLNGVIIYHSGSGEVLHFSTRDGLPHNKVNHIYIDSEKRGWISTVSNRLYYIKDGKLSLGKEIKYFQKKNEYVSVGEDSRGDLWAATYGNGVYHFRADTTLSFTTWSGLTSDYCYSLLADKRNNVWIGHRMGFTRILVGDKMVLPYSRESGISADCNPNAVFLVDEGSVLFGTSQGMIRYNPGNDRGCRIPPINNITSITFSDNPVDPAKEIRLPFDRYKLKISFIGLCYRNPEKVTYQYILENYDEEWSDLTPFNQVTYGLGDGEYTFLLRSYNKEGQTSPEPLAVHFVIRKPYWKTWWFIILVILVVVGSVVLIIKIRERNHKRLQAFLQKSLDERTKEVVEQKEEIEQKNREITDSINYAQRIQASILPPFHKLKDNFPGFFVLFQPRDIVSGDFYWYDNVGEDKFIIVCADSTGHGVPGAFMSMIGSTLIKDIVNRPHITRPSEILIALDIEITETLNQNREAEHSNDGMDMVVCEINLKSRHVRFASAMRPIILFHNGELLYIRGNRSSVGGEIVEEKVFEEQEYDLSEGDILYMFSDGYPDQFGGPLGKKYKMIRLKNLLEDIHDKPMVEQYEYVKNNFELWKSNFDQVDDVLFMAIKL